jgi:methyl-accepting chemotaxis protein
MKAALYDAVITCDRRADMKKSSTTPADGHVKELPGFTELSSRFSRGVGQMSAIVNDINDGLSDQAAAVLELAAAVDVLADAATWNNRNAALATIRLMEADDCIRTTTLAAMEAMESGQPQTISAESLNEITVKTALALQTVSDIVRTLSAQEETIAGHLAKATARLSANLHVSTEKAAEGTHVIKTLTDLAEELERKA